MNSQERKTIFSLCCVYAFRMLGLFMILPVFSLYAEHLKHANIKLVGVALGVYGLTQALLQIPFGTLSDRIGRKPIIITGLILFVIGSIVAALSHSIYGVIAGRALQGAGAIGSTLTALLADNTEDENRVKAMSFIGLTIGVSFMIALIIGPIINEIAGLNGIFWLTALLGCLGIIMVIAIVPTPTDTFLHRDTGTVKAQFKKILSMSELLRLDFGIFAMHATLTALFVVLPLLLMKDTFIQQHGQWFVYLPVLVLSFIAMVPFIIVAEAKRKMKPIFVGAVAVLTLTQVLFFTFSDDPITIFICMFLFFTAFTLLEATLPSLVAKIAPAGSKGTAMGIYSTSQFAGIFVGGMAGGYLFHHYSLQAVFALTFGLGFVWLLIAITMQKPQHLSSKVVSIAHLSDQLKIDGLQANIKSIPGVADVTIYQDEAVAYLKVDKKVFNEEKLQLVLHRP